jgi:uncharacterized membrane protein
VKRNWPLRLFAVLLIATGSYYATLAATHFVLMEIAVRRIAERGPMNSFTHAPPVRAEVRTIVRPSPDLLYSSCPFDLSDGPVMVEAWPIPERYSSISVFDARTDAVFVRNDEQMAGNRLRVILALHGQQVAPDQGAEMVRLNHPRGIVLQRVLLADPRDPAELARVDPLRRRATCRQLRDTNA